MFVLNGRHGELKPEWRDLLVHHPDRFMLAFDGVFRWLWLEDYAAEVAEWRAALESLPSDAAHAIGHGNAERLWKLTPPS